MVKWDLIRGLIPDVWSTKNKRNNVKSQHVNIRRRLKSEEPVQINFNEEYEASLGIATESHYKIKSLVRNYGHQRGHEYVIRDHSDREEIIEEIGNLIWKIRIANSISILMWLFLATFIVLVFGIATSISSSIILELLGA
ncbi:hypothetical protein [Candidatus Halobonum tyrrellensis]|uniref:hypothetical protein n=1 Tax=Candidatus Halobonum tyrrellensis TaxID=1431545 RepID=UPI0012694E89|nr:hypothetical protein [Candidatus Halobonum tyrrellensis]